MDNVTDEQIHDLAAAYVLDALDAEEQRAFEQHLEGCAACRDEVARLGGGAYGLAVAAEGPPPPDRLREQVLDSARAERATVVPLRRGWSPRWVAAVAVAACAAVAVGLWATLGGREGSRAREPQTIALKGAEGTLAVGRTGHAVLAVRGLSPAPAGKTYEIWVIPKGGKPLPAGLFSRAERVLLARKVPQGATVAVTVERAGGVATPTPPIRFSAVVPA